MSDKKIYSILEVFDKEILEKDINDGINDAIERAKDNGIEMKSSEIEMTNGNSNSTKTYKDRLINSHLNDKDREIISKYQNIKI